MGNIKHISRGTAKAFMGALAAALIAVLALAVCGQAWGDSRYEAVEATIVVEVAAAGDAAEADAEATVTITCEPAEGEEVSPGYTSVQVTGEGSFVFTVSLDEVSEHHYVVTQTAEDAEGWTFDETVYYVTVYCLWDEESDALYPVVIISDAENYKYEACSFTNTYTAPEAEEEEPEGDGMAKTGDSLRLVAAACAAVAVCGGVVLCVAWVRARRFRDKA